MKYIRSETKLMHKLTLVWFLVKKLVKSVIICPEVQVTMEWETHFSVVLLQQDRASRFRHIFSVHMHLYPPLPPLPPPPPPPLYCTYLCVHTTYIFGLIGPPVGVQDGFALFCTYQLNASASCSSGMYHAAMHVFGFYGFLWLNFTLFLM